MAKTIEFKKKPLKSQETESKLDQWVEQKTTEPPAPAAVETEPEEQGRALEAEQAPDQATAAPARKTAQKPRKQKVSFEKQEEEIEIAQVTFHMPKTLQRRLKLQCFKEDRTIKDYVIELLEKKLPKDVSF